MSEDHDGDDRSRDDAHEEKRDLAPRAESREERERLDKAEARSFHDVAAFDDLREGEMHTVSVAGRQVVLIRDGDHVAALGGKCSHKGAPMQKGAACRSPDHGQVLVCPWHKAVFSQRTGAVVEPVAFAPLPRYPVEILDGRVLVRAEPERFPAPPVRQSTESVLIVGGGAAAASAIYTLRQEGFGGAITMVGAEPELPYDRTALSKTLLLSDPARARAPLLLNETYYARHEVTHRHERVTAFDAASRTATLQSGATLSADHVLLAPGAKPRLPSLPGMELSGVLTLYTQADARRIAEAVTPEQAVILIGGGLICLEVASSLRQKGVGVTIVTSHAVPMEAQFGREIGMRLLQLHEDNGVAFISDTGVEQIYAADSNNANAKPKRVGGVELQDGMKLPCTHVLIASGTVPNVDFVSDLPQAPDGALIVDTAMRIAPGVYAAGDASAHQHEGHLWQSAHWRPAEVEGRIAAHSMLGRMPRKVPAPWYWTQQFGKKIEYLGWGEPFDNVVLRGSLRDFQFMAVCQRKGRPVALVSSGRESEMARAAVDFDRFMKEEGEKFLL